MARPPTLLSPALISLSLRSGHACGDSSAAASAIVPSSPITVLASLATAAVTVAVVGHCCCCCCCCCCFCCVPRVPPSDSVCSLHSRCDSSTAISLAPAAPAVSGQHAQHTQRVLVCHLVCDSFTSCAKRVFTGIWLIKAVQTSIVCVSCVLRLQ
jgi:hypothetical protein